MKAPSPFEEMTATGIGERPFTEDDVLDWWETYDNGEHYFTIAATHEQAPTVVRRELQSLGVWVGPVNDETAKRVALLKAAGGSAAGIGALLRWERGELSDEEQYLWNLVERMGSGLPIEGVEGRPLPYARSLPHVAANRQRTTIIQSARQRSLPGWGKHFGAIRAELRSAGLLPSVGVQSRRIGRYWL